MDGWEMTGIEGFPSNPDMALDGQMPADAASVGKDHVVHLAQKGNRKSRTHLREKAIAALSIIDLLFGLGTLYLGETIAYNCPEEAIGQPSTTCPPPQSFVVDMVIPTVIIVVSIIGLV